MAELELYTLKSQHDGLELALMLMRPEGEVQTLVQIAHGMCEHKERYEPLMRYLAARGCLCVINDHRGHGASMRSPDDLGYFYQDGDQGVVEDLHQITLWMRERWPGRRLILIGHSMGSLAARAYCQNYDRDIDALILLGSPGAHSTLSIRFGLALIRILSFFRGDRHHSPLIKNMTTGAFSRRFSEDEHENAWVSANLENVIAYEADPLCNFSFTLNGNRALLRLLYRAYNLRGPRGNPDMPVRFFSGGDDPCAPDAQGFEYAMECMRRAGYHDVQGQMFPGLRHEILNESNPEEIFSAIWQAAGCAR